MPGRGKRGDSSTTNGTGGSRGTEGRAFPVRPSFGHMVGRSSHPLLPTPCLQLCLPSPRARARPPGCPSSPFPRHLGALSGKGRSLLYCSQGCRDESSSLCPPSFVRQWWDRAAGTQRAHRTLCPGRPTSTMGEWRLTEKGAADSTAEPGQILEGNLSGKLPGCSPACPSWALRCLLPAQAEALGGCSTDWYLSACHPL